MKICCNHDCQQSDTCPLRAMSRLDAMADDAARRYDHATFGGGEPAYPDWVDDVRIVSKAVRAPIEPDPRQTGGSPDMLTVAGAFFAVILLVLLLASASASAAVMFAPMSEADIGRQVAITAALAVDHHQTQQIRQIREFVPPGVMAISEGNPLIQRHFSEAGIRNYFVVAAVGSAVVTKALPADWRPAYQYGVLALQLAVIVKNKRAGLSIAI